MLGRRKGPVPVGERGGPVAILRFRLYILDRVFKGEKMRKKYEVWLSKKICETDDRNIADEVAFMEMADEPAPDKHNFMKVKIKIREDVGDEA